jgi:single-strand DNA-binding protein
MTNNTVNRIELIGYMGAMPELRYIGNGTPVTNFSLATNRIWQAPDGERRKETDWHRVTAWGRLAEVVNTYMGTGKRVRVVGRLEYQSWRDAASGETRSRAVVIASQVLFLDYDRAQGGLPAQPADDTPSAEAHVLVDPQAPPSTAAEQVQQRPAA